MMKKLCVKFLKNQGGLNILKMRCNGKYESVTFTLLFTSVANLPIYAVDSKLFNLSKLLFAELG